MSEEIDFSAAADIIKELLSGDEGQQQLQGIISMLSGEKNNSAPPGAATGGINPDNLEMMFKLQQLMSVMNSAESSKQTAFLESLKSLLRPDRHERIDRAVRIYGIGRAIEAFKKIGGI